jgi:hypothetical protein
VLPNGIAKHKANAAQGKQAEPQQYQRGGPEDEFPVAPLFQRLQCCSAKHLLHTRLSGASLTNTACKEFQGLIATPDISSLLV